MLSTPLLALAGAASPEVREKPGEREVFGVGASHPQHEPVEVPSLGAQGSLFTLDRGCGSAGACREAGEAPQGGGPLGPVGGGRGPASPPGAPAAWEAGTV